jgi:subtilisin family serine protease
MTSRRVLIGVVLIVLSLGLVLHSGPSVAAATLDKIAPRVLAETASSGTTEALVVLTEQADLTPASALNTKLEKGRFVVNALRAVADRTQAPIVALLEQRGVAYQSFYIVNMIKVTGNRGLMQELAARSDVARIDANPYVRTSLPVPIGAGSKSDVPPTVEWNIKQVHAPQVWALGFRGQGRVVAGADTGVQWDHPALKLHYRGWKGGKVSHKYNWHDAVDHTKVPFDPFGHGTFTVSEMVGDDGHGNQIGVAPRAKWIACRNMDANGTGSPARYTECFEFLIAPYPIGGNPRQGKSALAPDSINNSWECPASEGCSANTLLKVVNAVRAAGIFPAMAAENSGPACSTVNNPPGIYGSAVSVGATDSGNNIADFSSRGPVTVDHSNRLKPNLSAPGVNVRGAVPTNQYQSGWSGTSMATPHLAGGVALLWQAKPALIGNITKTESIFTHSSLPLRSTQNCGGSGQKIPNNVFGWGLLDLLKAVKAH